MTIKDGVKIGVGLPIGATLLWLVLMLMLIIGALISSSLNQEKNMKKITITIEVEDTSEEDYSLVQIEREVAKVLLKCVTIGQVINIEATRD